MSGAIVQLAAVGAQDVYLTSQPQITFFKTVYRRYTNFAIDSVAQHINGNPTFGSKISVTISRNGDLLKNLWIQYNPQKVLSGVIPVNNGDTVGANVGHSIINTADLEINNQIIDRQYGKWLTIWNYLTESNQQVQGNIGNNWEEPTYGDTATSYDGERATRYNIMAYTHRAQISDGIVSTAGPPSIAWVPLRFWFCRNPGLAIPIIALQYSEIKLNITLGTADGIYQQATPNVGNGDEFSDLKVYADYIYLDTAERTKFAQNSHEYLIDQLQINENQTQKEIKLYFKNPVKELIWSPIPKPVYFDGNDDVNVLPGLSSPNSSLSPGDYSIIVNGAVRSSRDYRYYTRNQIWDYHTGYGSVLFPDSVGVYSFSLRPEEFQPSGTCNFSRLDSVQLVRTSEDAIDIYAINYNVLRIMSGIGGLAYLN